MVDFDKFEKIVKDKYGNQDFPFDEQNWEKAAKLIDESRKGKNRGGFFFLSAIGLLCITGLVYYFGFSDSSSALRGKDLAVNQAVTEKQNENTYNSISTENNSVSGDEGIAENSNVTPETKAINKSSVTTDVNSTSVKNNSKNNTSSVAANTSENSTVAKASEKNNTSSSNETGSEEKTTSNSSNTNSETKTNSNPSTNSKSKNTTPEKSTPNKNTTPPVLSSNNTMASNAPKTGSEPTANNVGGSTEKLGTPSNKDQTGVVIPITIGTDPIVIDSSAMVVTATIKPIESLAVDSFPFVRKSKADSLAAMLPKGDGVSYATNVKEKHNAKNILFLEAGTTYLLGWNGGGKNEAGGFNLLAGVNFQHYFTGAIAAQIGVQYNTISNLTNSTHTIGTVKYDLGVEQDVTAIKYQKLHYLVAPIRFTYALKDNTFSIGCNVAYLLNSDSKKEKYKTYSSDPNATKNDLTSTKETGYVQGFNPYDVQLALGYKRKIYKGLSAGADFFYGLTDTKNNEFFKSNTFDRNVGVKVSLCYDLFKK